MGRIIRFQVGKIYPVEKEYIIYRGKLGDIVFIGWLTPQERQRQSLEEMENGPHNCRGFFVDKLYRYDGTKLTDRLVALNEDVVEAELSGLGILNETLYDCYEFLLSQPLIIKDKNEISKALL